MPSNRDPLHDSPRRRIDLVDRSIAVVGDPHDPSPNATPTGWLPTATGGWGTFSAAGTRYQSWLSIWSVTQTFPAPTASSPGPATDAVPITDIGPGLTSVTELSARSLIQTASSPVASAWSASWPMCTEASRRWLPVSNRSSESPCKSLRPRNSDRGRPAIPSKEGRKLPRTDGTTVSAEFELGSMCASPALRRVAQTPSGPAAMSVTVPPIPPIGVTSPVADRSARSLRHSDSRPILRPIRRRSTVRQAASLRRFEVDCQPRRGSQRCRSEDRSPLASSGARAKASAPRRHQDAGYDADDDDSSDRSRGKDPSFAQARPRNVLCRLCQLPLASGERRIRRPERRKFFGEAGCDELIKTDWPVEILETLLPQITKVDVRKLDLLVFQDILRRLRHQYLSAVSGGADSSCTMNRDAEVALSLTEASPV